MAGQKFPKTIIGLEVHVQLDTKSKLFCACTTSGVEPNTATCEICLGFPGSKPMLNRRAVELAVKTALALNCKLNKEFFFSRKTYFYPDLSKNYQITQFERPVGEKGFLEVNGKKIEITRLQLEEDPAALVHEQGMTQSNYSLVDYNRSGVPLIEIVTSPCMESPKEAKEFLNALAVNLEYLCVFDSSTAVLKADANISLQGGERVEIKNVHGFRAVEKALEAEILRQQKAFESGQPIERTTRGFDEASNSTFLLRKKETEEDYGYIFDPDLPIVELAEKEISAIKKSLPELLAEKTARYVKKLGLSEYDAAVIASNPVLAGLFEETIKKANVQLTAKFLSRELLGVAKYNNLQLKTLGMSAKHLSALLELLDAGKVSEKNAKESVIKYMLEKMPPKEFLEKNNLLLDVAKDDVEKIVQDALAKNPAAVKDLKAGNARALNFLVGLIMKQTKGKAQPRTVQKIIEEKIAGK